jgi:hypothetical protein
VLADGTDGSSRGMGRASGPSPRRSWAAAPMRRLPAPARVTTNRRGAAQFGKIEPPGVSQLKRSDGRARRRIVAVQGAPTSEAAREPDSAAVRRSPATAGSALIDP